MISIATLVRRTVIGLSMLATMLCFAETLAPSRAAKQLRSVSLNETVINLTLSDAVYLGLRDNRNIQSAYLERISQKFDLRVEENRFAPNLVLSARHIANRNQNDHYRRTEVVPQTTLNTQLGTRFSLSWSNQLTHANHAGRFRNDGANLAVIQPLLRGAGRDVATAPLRLARLNEQSYRLRLKATISNTIMQIIMAYRDLLRAQEQLQIAREALSRSAQLMEANRTMINAGRMAAFEIVQTEADAASQELTVVEAGNQLDANRLALLQLLALDLHTPILAVDALEIHRIDVVLDDALQAAQAKQPAYLMQQIATEQAEISLMMAHNERKWDISLVGAASQVRDRYPQASGRANHRTWEGYVGIQADIALGDLHQRQAEVRARVELHTQQVRLDDARQSLEREVSDVVRDLGARWRQYEIALRARDLSRRKLEIEREKLQAGRSSNFQVISFESDLRIAENARLNALIGYINAQSRLDQTLGTTLESWDIVLDD